MPQKPLPKAALELDHVFKKFGSDNERENIAVNDLSLALEPGELVTLLGPSGCGKTTTLRMLAGFEEVTSGSISIDNKDITYTPANRRKMGMVFQNYALFPHLPVGANVSYGLRVQKVGRSEIDARVGDVLALMGLEGMADRMPADLSGGQQQRVALARAVVTEPRVLLFDEPLSNLDANLRVYMREELRRIQRRVGITSIYVTHDQDEAMAISDRIAIMNDGFLVQVGTPEEIYQRPRSRFVAEFIGRAQFLNGEVSEAGVDGTRVDVMGESVMMDRDMGSVTSEGSVVDVVVRPEFWLLGSDGPFVGIVVRATYFGNFVEYDVKIGEKHFTVEDYEHRLHGRWKEGDSVALGLREGVAAMLPHGDHGYAQAT